MEFKKGAWVKKSVAWLLAAAMVFQSCPITAQAEDSTGYVKTCPTIGDNGDVTFHYYPNEGEEVNEVYVKGSWDGSWGVYYYLEKEDNGVWSKTVNLSLDNSYEYGLMVNGNWAGDPTNTRVGGNSQILRNPVMNSDGSYTIFYYPNDNDQDVNLLYKTSDQDDYKSIDMNWDEYHPQILSATITDAGSYEYKFEVNGTEVADKNTLGASFNISGVKLEDDENVKSPVIEGTKVTFNYFSPSSKTVYVAGSMNGWNSSADVMDYDENTGFWSKTLELDPGDYEYKFVADGNWTTDPKNADTKNGNSFFNISLDENAKLDSPVVNGTKVTFNYYSPKANAVYLAGSMNGWNNQKDLMTFDEEKGYWSITLRLENGQYEYKFVKDGEWVTDPANNNYSNGNSAFEVNYEGYTYNLYYYDAMHSSKDSTSLWIWTDGQNGVQYFYDEAVTLEDGNTWLKATVDLDFTKLNIIPRAYADWSWQDVDKNFDNVDEAKTSTIYLVNGDSKVYTKLPEFEKKTQRYVLVEYTRENNDYDGWEIYTWNSGYGSAAVIGFKEVNGKMVAYVPVTDTKDGISFCMRRSEPGNDWAEKDGGDHDVKIPLDQTIVKAQFVQGKGVVGNTAYNLGYETNVEEGTITFYYRDDELFADYKEADLAGKVKLVSDGNVMDMTYDSEEERFVANKELEAGEHYYGYEVDGKLVLDKFNKTTTDVDGVTYSQYKYVKAEAAVTAKLSKTEINYNENAVLTVEVDSDDIRIVDITSDLSALGQSKSFKIDPELMAGTIAVKEGTSLGEKTIPVVIKDSYGNKYDTSVTCTVVNREKGDDFDWDEAVIYFAVTDRFFDGNSENNDAYGKGSYDLNQGSLYHGGDFAGLNEKLDYLKDLGVNTIWITPIVENTDTVSVASSQYPDQMTTAYHGYWANDFTKLDAHLGTEAEFKALLDAAHKKGMKIMVDVVLNHAGYGTEDKFGDMLRNKDNTVSGDEKRDGLAGLPDFATENSEVRNLLVEWQSNWISKYDIDYYRVDTVKHVDDTTWKAFKNALTLINPEFKMIGEYAGAGYATSAGQLGTGQMDALLDFDFNDKALDFVTGNVKSVESFLEDRNVNIDNTAMMGSFLGSHDEDGFLYRLVNERHVSNDKAYALSKVAAALQITAKGQPVIYYGEELGQTGANNWPYQENRYDFDWTKVNADNDMLTHYEKLLEIRNANTEIFAKGTRASVAFDDTNTAIVVERSYKGEKLYVGLNTNYDKSVSVKVSDLEINTEYKDLYSDTTVKTDENGVVEVTIPSAKSGGTVILEKNARVETGNNDNNDVNVPTTSDSQNTNTEASVAVAASIEETVKAPTYKRADGITVSGWSNVVKAALADTVANMLTVTNPNAFVAGYQIPVVTITVDKDVNKSIPANVIKEMSLTGATYKFVLQSNVIITLNQNALLNVNGAFSLDSNIYRTDMFGQGFKGIVVSPYINAKTGNEVAVTVDFGKENAGKPVYAFTRHQDELVFMRKAVGFISKEGIFELNNVDLVNYVFLY